MSYLSKAADLAQRAATLGLFGLFIASGVGIGKQIKEFQESSRQNAAAAAAEQKTTVLRETHQNTQQQ